MNEHLLSNEEKQRLKQFHSFGAMHLILQQVFSGLGSLIASCYVDVSFSRRYPIFRNSIVRLGLFTCFYYQLTQLYHFSRTENLRVFSHDMVNKYREASIDS